MDSSSELLQRFAGSSRAAATARAYAADWRDFLAWCADRQVSSLPATPEAVALYLAERSSELKVSTLGRRLSAIVMMHRDQGAILDVKHPTLVRVWRGIRRTYGTAKRGKRPLSVEELRAIVQALPKSTAGIRDRALILVGFAGSFRRSELVNLRHEDVEFTSRGIVITLHHRKDDPLGAGGVRAIPYGQHPETCPVRALSAWVKAAGLDGGPLFRSVDRKGPIGGGALDGGSVARIIKRAVTRWGKSANMVPAEIARLVAVLSGHSLRAGLVTAAAEAGAPEWEIMVQSGHRRRETLFDYIRLGTLFEHNVAGKIGL